MEKNKPIGWMNVVDTNTGKTIGLFNSTNEGFLKPTIILNEYSINNVETDLEGAALYMLNLLEETYGKLTILNERII